MKRRTRAWQSRTAAAARWTLTLLLVALVGVTVASGWWAAKYGRLIFVDGGATTHLLVLDVRRGSVTVTSIRRPTPDSGWERTQFFELQRYPDPAYAPPPPGALPFSLWRVEERRFGYSAPLTLPTVAVALPTLFLWYRRIFRRYGRGHCQCCGYDLAGLAVTDQRITCPECGRVAVVL